MPHEISREPAYEPARINFETAALLDSVFGEQLPATLAESASKLGFRVAVAVTVDGHEVFGIDKAAASLLIRTAVCTGIGDLPSGWSLLPAEGNKAELVVWVLGGTPA